MKKKYYTSFLILLLSIGFNEHALTQDCDPGSSQLNLITPRAKIRHRSGGSLWWDNQNGKFLIDDQRLSNGPVSVAFAAGFWAGGKDPGGNIKLASSLYGPGQDWWPGPLDENGFISPTGCDFFDRIWQVTKTEIDHFLEDLADNGILDDPIPDALLEWPGRNNPHSITANGFDLPQDDHLAPFHDEDQDGKYDPTKGDYPFTKGAAVAHWWIFNDAGNEHTESNSQPMNLEVSVLAYHFDTDPQGNTTIFYDTEITNKSFKRLEDFYFGLWIDPDLGCLDDDYIGCSPETNLAYVYNDSEIDGDLNCNCQQGVPSFCNGIPLFGVRVLDGLQDENDNSHGMSSFLYYNNSSIYPDPSEPPINFTIYPEGFHNALSGVWFDGIPATNGGTGYDPSSSDITTHVFPDDPNDPNGWSMCTEELESKDRRIIMASGATAFDPRQKNKFAFAAIVTGPVAHPCPDITPLINAANDAQTTYDGLPLSLQKPAAYSSLVLAPNPANEFVNVSLENNKFIKTLILSNSNGKVFRTINNINQQQYQLLKNDLASGVYFIQVISADGEKGVEKVIFFN